MRPARTFLHLDHKERKNRRAEGGSGRRRQREDLSRLLRERTHVFGIGPLRVQNQKADNTRSDGPFIPV